MQGNSNFERNTRKERNSRPPRGEQGVERHPQAKRGKQWTRDNDKREQSQFFNSFQ
jgi:hypothetical protein